MDTDGIDCHVTQPKLSDGPVFDSLIEQGTPNVLENGMKRHMHFGAKLFSETHKDFFFFIICVSMNLLKMP